MRTTPGIDCGTSFENFAAQELKAHGFNLHYFNSKKHGELDFLIDYQGEPLPLLIKSGKDYQTHSALSYFCSNGFSKGYVFSDYNVSVKGNVHYYPIYLMMFLHSQNEITEHGAPDLSVLSARV